MNRRKVIQLIGVGSVAGFAGCASDDPDNPGGGESTDTPTATEIETETETETEAPEPAAFELVEYNIPETVQIGTEVTLEITIRNTGGQAGDFSAPLYVRTPDSNWQEVGEWTFSDIPPGESVTGESFESTVFDYIQRYEFRLGQSSETTVLQTVSAKLPWGGEYTTPEGYRMRADTPTLQDSYEYENYNGNIRNAEPDNGGQWVFLNAWVKNETGQTNFSPLANEFALLYGNSQSDAKTLLVDEPINKNESFDGGELQPGVERSGWIAYEVPSEIQLNELTLAWSKNTFNGEIAVNWGVS